MACTSETSLVCLVQPNEQDGLADCFSILLDEKRDVTAWSRTQRSPLFEPIENFQPRLICKRVARFSCFGSIFSRQRSRPFLYILHA